MALRSKLIFWGTSEFAVRSLDALITAGYQPSLVVTQPDRPVGRKKQLRPTPIKLAAEKYGLSVMTPHKIKDASLVTQLKKHAPEIMVVVSYGKIIPAEILALPTKGVVNVHGSILPKFRGASPIQQAIIDGEPKTGVTIMLMDELMDHGPILSTAEITIEKNDTYISLSDKLGELGARLLINTLPDYLSGKIIARPQNHDQASYTKIISREDGQIDWTKPAEILTRELRAYTPWPGLYTFWRDQRLKIIEAEAVNLVHDTATVPGLIFKHDQKILVATGDNQALEIITLQLAGQKPRAVEDFTRGHDSFIGSILKTER